MEKQINARIKLVMDSKLALVTKEKLIKVLLKQKKILQKKKETEMIRLLKLKSQVAEAKKRSRYDDYNNSYYSRHHNHNYNY